MHVGVERTESIVYSGFAPVAAEELRPVFERLGLELICLTGGADAETFERATAARCSFGQCFVQADYFLEYLEQEHGVKRFLEHQPNGGIGFERFLRDLAAFLGKEDAAEEIIAEERAKYAGSLERLRGALAGRRAVIALGPGYAFEAARMLGELGVETAHAIAYHYDPGIGRGGGMGCAAADVRELGLDVEASLSNAQELETYLIIKRLKPDIVVSRAHGANGWAAKMGIPCLDMGLGLNLVGYRGLHLLGHGVESVLRNTAFLDRLGARYVSPFSELLENMDPRGFCGEGGAE
jgi:nitrogenase molybdenum-iron protein alpha chain